MKASAATAWRALGLALTAFIGAVILSGCGTGAGTPAVGVWELSHPDQVGVESTELKLAVTRHECSGGTTGRVLEPLVVEYQDSRILIEIGLEPLPEGAYECLDNDSVPVTVRLTEPVGERQLVDAACLGGEVADTASCRDSGVRWEP